MTNLAEMMMGEVDKLTDDELDDLLMEMMPSFLAEIGNEYHAAGR